MSESLTITEWARRQMPGFDIVSASVPEPVLLDHDVSHIDHALRAAAVDQEVDVFRVRRDGRVTTSMQCPADARCSERR